MHDASGSIERTLSAENSFGGAKYRGQSISKGRQSTKDGSVIQKRVMLENRSNNPDSKIEVVNSNLSIKSGGSKLNTVGAYDNKN